MKLVQIRDLTAVAQRGSMRAAARQLGITQAAISRSIREIEHELGVPLFERGTKGVVLTPLGQVFLRRALVIGIPIEAAIRGPAHSRADG